MDNDRNFKPYLLHRGVILVLVLVFWVPMVALYCKYANSLATLGEDAEDIAKGYEVMLQRCIFATRIAGVILLSLAFLYIIVRLCRDFRKRSKK